MIVLSRLEAMALPGGLAAAAYFGISNKGGIETDVSALEAGAKAGAKAKAKAKGKAKAKAASEAKAKAKR